MKKRLSLIIAVVAVVSMSMTPLCVIGIFL